MYDTLVAVIDLARGEGVTIRHQNDVIFVVSALVDMGALQLNESQKLVRWWAFELSTAERVEFIRRHGGNNAPR